MSYMLAVSGSERIPEWSGIERRDASGREKISIVRHFSRHMRSEDRLEMKRLTGNGAEHEIVSSINMSDVVMVAFSDDGTPLSILGGRWHNIVDGEAQLWSLSTDACNSRIMEFARGCRHCLKVLMDCFPGATRFTNYMDLGYNKAVRWVRWMGAEFPEDDRFRSVFGGEFGKFVLKREV